jgi:16S rRNA (cytidine1402-2'-O)-methyltransferase
MPIGKVYLIPNVLHEDEIALNAVPAYVLAAIKDCAAFFTENEKTARRYFKRLWKDMPIDHYQWFAMHKAEESVRLEFIRLLQSGENIGIVSDAGCPGIADPGQILVNAAQQIGAEIAPLVGPSSIILALMASGLNGQQFQFNGYLPVESLMRKKILRHLEDDSQKRNCTQIFIETPYRNHALLNEILATCHPSTKLCIAVNITATSESIRTKTIAQWKKETFDLHKKPTIFLLSAY